MFDFCLFVISVLISIQLVTVIIVSIMIRREQCFGDITKASVEVGWLGCLPRWVSYVRACVVCEYAHYYYSVLFQVNAFFKDAS